VAGVKKVLYAFQGATDVSGLRSRLINVNGMLYGTTEYGGQAQSNFSYGTVYRISTEGAEKLLYRYAGGSDGANPAANLIDTNGMLYGTTRNDGGGGSCGQSHGNCGTIFSITTGGVEKVLYSFTGGGDGKLPVAPLTNVNGTLYGTTTYGGIQGRGSGFVTSIPIEGASAFAGGAALSPAPTR
jgi:uncharacterized repeat protein (TIGR03803 family)